MTDSLVRRFDRGLAIAWALAAVALCVYVAVSAPTWLAWATAGGLELSFMEVAIIDLGAALRTVPGAVLALTAIALYLRPGGWRPAWSGRAWFGLGVVQAVALGVVCHELFWAPERWAVGPGELSRCGNVRFTVPGTILMGIVCPALVLQSLVWSTFAGSALRAPRGPVLVEVRRAAVIAALPALVVTILLHCDGGLRGRDPGWLLVPVPLAASITACGLLGGGALWLRLARPEATYGEVGSSSVLTSASQPSSNSRR